MHNLLQRWNAGLRCVSVNNFIFRKQ